MSGERARKLRDAIAAEIADLPDALPPGEVERVLACLDRLPDPVPAEAMTADLIRRLRRHLPGPRFRAVLEAQRPPLPGRALALLAAVRPQAGLLGGAFWLASAAVGLALTVVATWAMADAAAALVLVAPLLAVGGVGFAFRGVPTGLWEAERACPLDPLTLALARFVVVAAYDAGLMGLVTLALGPGGKAALLLAWLAPFLFLGTVAFLAALRWGGAVGAAAGTAAWAILVSLHQLPAAVDPLSLPGAPGWLAVKLGLVALSALLWWAVARPGPARRWLEV